MTYVKIVAAIFFSGWWFGSFFIFPYIGNLIIPIDVHIFQRAGPGPPTMASTSHGDFTGKRFLHAHMENIFHRFSQTGVPILMAGVFVNRYSVFFWVEFFCYR